MEDSQKRQVAQKLRIAELIEGRYVKEEGWQPNYIIIPRGEKVSRVNIFATVVMVEPGSPSASLTLDDGSGTISVRSFEDNPLLRKFDVGAIINIIGRPREYNGEKYIVPEIIREIKDPRWLELRNLELKERDTTSPTHVETATAAIANPKIETQVEEVVAIQPTVKTESAVADAPKKNPFELMYELIRKLDSGEGADISEVIDKSGIANAEELLKQLMREGEIFEIKRGRIKVLE